MSEDLIRALLVEDHEITRLGMRKMLEQIGQIEVVAEACSGKIAVDIALELKPNLILMDIGLPDMDGIEATRLIKEALPLTKIIVITSHDNDEDILAGLTAGADAYCLKGINGPQLESAVQSVLDGGVWLDPGIARRIMKILLARSGSLVPEKDEAGRESIHLSEREHQVLCLLVEGLTNHQMAQRLNLSVETIKTHMRHIMDKLRVADRTQAAVKAIKEGLVPPPPLKAREQERTPELCGAGEREDEAKFTKESDKSS